MRSPWSCGESADRCGSGLSSSASRMSKIRSADATPLCIRLNIDPIWVSGWVNCREYWMNACTSPRLSDPDATRSPPTTATADVVEVPQEHDGRHDDPGDELGPPARLVQLLVALVEARLDLLLPPERLDQFVAGERLLDLRVEGFRSTSTAP